MALPENKLRCFAGLVKIEHTVFALPFAYLGALLAVSGRAAQVYPFFMQLFWITVAMVGARSAAMGLNRLIDRGIDRANPRTAGRHLPRGLLTAGEVRVFIAGAAALFALAVYRLSPGHVGWVLPVVLAMAGYCYTKRFTWLSHFVLGLIIGLAPLGGWIAVRQKAELPAYLLWLSVASWVAGFDIIYAALDRDFDQAHGLHSLPADKGLPRAFGIAAFLHILMVALLLTLYHLVNLGWWYLGGVAVAALLLVYEHSLVAPHDLSRMNTAFFQVNGIIGLQLLAFTILDLWG